MKNNKGKNEIEYFESGNDKKISDRIWNTYLKKYKDNYQITTDEIDINHIKCKPKKKNCTFKSDMYNTIQNYSIVNKQLCFVAEFDTKIQLTYFKKKLNGLCNISQDGEWDIVVVFHENDLDALSDIFLCHKRRIISSEQKKELQERVKRARGIKKIGGFN